MRTGFVVHHCGVFFKPFVRTLLRCLAQCDNGFGVIQMVLFVLAAAHFMRADTVQNFVRAKSQWVKRSVVAPFNVRADFFKSHTLNLADGVGEIFVYNIVIYAYCLKNLRRLIRLQG